MNQLNYKKTQYNEPFISQRADPYVTRDDEGRYLFTASVPAYDEIILRRSETLDGLKDSAEKTIWKKHDKGIMSQHIWAPEIHKVFDEWYIYFAASDVDDIWALRPYVLHCKGSDPMTDEWEECGQMQRCDEDEFSFNDFSLDMTVFENKGHWYAIWAEKVNIGKKISNLYIAEMESATKLKTPQTLLTAPDFDWERIGFWVNEGPGIIRHDGKIFMTYSASSTGVCYAVGLLSISEDDEILNPHAWTKSRLPVLSTDMNMGILGPGHNSFTTITENDGSETDVVIYHARQYDEIEGDPLYDPNRHTYRMKVLWDKYGCPIFDIHNNF